MLTIKQAKPYFAVIFTSKHANDTDGYEKMAQEMELLAEKQNGYLGIESAKNYDKTSSNFGVGITVSYWESLEAIKNWKMNAEHLVAQQIGKEKWYEWYSIKICKVEREYNFNAK